MKIADPLRHHKHYENSGPGASPYAGGSSFMERVSEAVASGMGDLTEQIHQLAEQLTALTTEVHRTICHGESAGATASK